MTNSILQEFITLASEHSMAQYQHNEFKKNRAGNGLYRIWQKAKTDENLKILLIDSLLYNASPNVRLWICSIALDTKYRAFDAERILTELADGAEESIEAKNAKKLLLSWKEHSKFKSSDLI